jgi:hypothetical protein
MRVRLVFYCPRCGSLLFRPSLSRTFRDNFLRPIGFHAQRCYMCRLRFYLFKPVGLGVLASAFEGPAERQRSEPAPKGPGVETAKSHRLVAGDLLRHNR